MIANTFQSVLPSLLSSFATSGLWWWSRRVRHGKWNQRSKATCAQLCTHPGTNVTTIHNTWATIIKCHEKNMMICDTCQHMFFQLSSNVQHLHHCPRLCTRHACTIMHPKIEAQNGTDIGTLAYSTVHPDSMFMFQHVYVETSTLVSNYLFLGSFV